MQPSLSKAVAAAWPWNSCAVCGVTAFAAGDVPLPPRKWRLFTKTLHASYLSKFSYHYIIVWKPGYVLYTNTVVSQFHSLKHEPRIDTTRACIFQVSGDPRRDSRFGILYPPSAGEPNVDPQKLKPLFWEAVRSDHQFSKFGFYDRCRETQPFLRAYI